MKTQPYVLDRPTTLLADTALTWSSGFLATLAITTIMYVMPAVGLPQVDLPIWAARVLVAGTVPAATVGMAVHLAVGLMLAWVYTLQVEPRLASGPGTSGLIYGAAIWAFAQVVAVPTLGAAAEAAGWVGTTPGVVAYRLGLGAALGSLVAHLAYGGTLGYVYGCRGGGRCRPR
ncbi:MAG: hypothetical protein AB7H88_09665 [Vicinamibacterales bacterium]